MNSRGPGNSPLSVASFRPQSAPPVSRTLVKPRSSILCIRRAARAVISVSGTLSMLRITTSDSTTWTWLSIRPGISVRPPQSMTSAFASWIGLAETSLIKSPSTTSSWPPRNSPAPGSSISKFLKW
jgi:hypothetical protein